jgi:hypothetical protein
MPQLWHFISSSTKPRTTLTLGAFETSLLNLVLFNAKHWLRCSYTNDKQGETLYFIPLTIQVMEICVFS